MKPRFITKTFPNHQSIATGLKPESHGVVDNVLWDSKYDQLLDGKDGRDHRFWNYDASVLPLWTLNALAKGGRASGAVMWPGSNHPYSGIVPSYLINYSSSTPVRSSIDAVVGWVRNVSNPVNLVYMYVGRPDGAAHSYGPESPQVIQDIAQVNGHVGYLINQLKGTGLWDAVNLVLLSDHGFNTVRKAGRINLGRILSLSLYYANGASPVLHVTPKDGKFVQVYDPLLRECRKNRHFRVYKRDELPSGWHYRNERRVGPIVLVADVGYGFDDLEYAFSANPERSVGVYGYDNEEASMRAIFMGHGPAFKTGARISWLRNIDTFPLFCNILQLNCPASNGTMEYVKELLV